MWANFYALHSWIASHISELPAFQPKGPRLKGTMVHQVSGRETLTSLAVRYKLTIKSCACIRHIIFFFFFLERHTSWFCFVLQTASTFFPSLAALPVWCHRGSTPHTYMCMICHYFWKNVLKNYIFDNILYNSLFLDTPGIE